MPDVVCVWRLNMDNVCAMSIKINVYLASASYDSDCVRATLNVGTENLTGLIRLLVHDWPDSIRASVKIWANQGLAFKGINCLSIYLKCPPFMVSCLLSCIWPKITLSASSCLFVVNVIFLFVLHAFMHFVGANHALLILSFS